MLTSLVRRFLPRNHFGDLIYVFLKFAKTHKRFPRKTMTFNDVLFDLQRSEALSSPLRVFVTDKEYVKIFVKSVLGDTYNIPTLAVLKTDAEIDQFEFPPDCCIKATHSSGRTMLRRNNAVVDRAKLKSWLRENYYTKSREINYRTLEPKIIIESILWDNDNLQDYKFFCFRGKVGLIQVDFDRYVSHTRLLFDKDWRLQNYGLCRPRADAPCPKPDNFAQMIDAAQALSARFDFVRIDLYSDGASCKLGEITNCHGGGNERFVPPSAEIAASKLIFGNHP